MTRITRTLIEMALLLVALALAPNAAVAQSYTGNRQMTETITGQFKGKHTYCLALTDNASEGFAHSGPAVLNGSGFSNLQGIFQVANGLLVATFYVQSGQGSLSGLVFVGPASNGNIGKGFAESVSGAATITGTLVFGAVGGC